MRGYVGKYRRKRRIPLISWLLILTAILCLTVGGVVAYLSTYTGGVTNAFVADTPTDPAVLEETFTGNSKTNVKVDVGNPGYAVYVRAAVVVTWKDVKNGNVLGSLPIAGTDYNINYNLTDWFYRESDGFYYHKAPVAYDGTEGSNLTGNLINSCTPVDGKTPTGYGLNVEIIAQTIQAVGTTDEDNIPAVKAAWDIEVDESNLEN